MPFTHIAFADETNYNRGAFPGIGLLSLERTAVSQTRADITTILQKARVGEFKWSRLHSAKRRFAAMQLIEYIVEKSTEGRLRMDVLTWDLQDGRHRVPKPDRINNLQRMYFHLFRNVLRTRWPDEALWQLCPDEHTAVAWHELHDYLNGTSIHPVPPIIAQTAHNQLQKEFHIYKITPCQSHTEPLIQVADLFVGLASYSRAAYERIKRWQQENRSGQIPMFVQTAVQLSHADKERCQVISELNQLCKKKRLGVSFHSHQGLRTLNPNKPINFWWYTPQHIDAKAPSRP
jgi:hypothetical protein